MPHYEYHCNQCNKEFDRYLSIAESEHEKITCPSCGSEKVEQKISPFFAVTGKKS